MNPITSNPFTILTIIAAPAVLTNACSVLALGTSNRFARAIDRARALSQILETSEQKGSAPTVQRIRQLNRIERRSVLLLQALRIFYFSLGSFAAASMVSLIGAAVATSEHHVVFRVAIWAALLTGLCGVGGLVCGCSILVHETQLAVRNVQDEASLLRERFKEFLTESERAGEPG